MIDPKRKQAALHTRANYQLQEVKTACREVIAMARELNTYSAEVASSEVNCRKVQILKGEIKDKLRQHAGSIDAVCQLLDHKIHLILAEINRLASNEAPTSPTAPITTLCRKCSRTSTNNSEQRGEGKVGSFDTEFSETLNPRIARLEAKIGQYQANEMKLRGRIAELQIKNESLLEEFNRLSTASNKKINQLNSKISKDSRQEPDQVQSPNKQAHSPHPLQFSPSKRKINSVQPIQPEIQYYHPEGSYTADSFGDKTRILNFGCMPKGPKSNHSNNSLRGSNATEQHEKLDRHDRNRRFDLLLNKLRDSQQENIEGSRTQEMRRLEEPIAYSPIRKHHI